MFEGRPSWVRGGLASTTEFCFPLPLGAVALSDLISGSSGSSIASLRSSILTIRVGSRIRTQSCEAVFTARYQINRPASEYVLDALLDERLSCPKVGDV